MIIVFLANNVQREFHDVKSALRFMYLMKNKGYFILGWQCDDPEDNDWLNRRFKQ